MSTESAPPATTPIEKFFPLASPRPQQTKILQFIERAYLAGYNDIVVAAPTGVGKSAIGLAVANWAATINLKRQPGGYYLVTQKLLQDQLDSDIKAGKLNGVNLKSASEYPCSQYKNCAVGMQKKCSSGPSCSYRLQKSGFLNAAVGVTNYSYFFTEREHVGDLVPRNVLILDECHSLEGQIINHVDVRVSDVELEEFAPEIERVPVRELETMKDFVVWLTKTYLPVVTERLESLIELADGEKDDLVVSLGNHVNKVKRGVELILKSPKNWVYWTEKEDSGAACIARPIDASPFYLDMVGKAAPVRVHMSAYPGSKKSYCRSLGLSPDDVAWISVGSPFPVENRAVHVLPVGSMSLRNRERTFPSLVKIAVKIARKYSEEKGIIHSISYEIGTKIVEGLKQAGMGDRIIFPLRADERESAYKLHRESTKPTIIVSPSMVEGFDFYGDAARWQIIAKVPYPFLGNRQIEVKKSRDPDWYAMVTAMSIIQATGRVCRSVEDTGVTYILDSDFIRLWGEYQEMFPAWYRKAVNFPKK